MNLNDDDIGNIHETLKRVIRAKYYPWCRRLGWTKSDIFEWAEEVAGEGISLGLKDLERWDPRRGTVSCWFYLKTNTRARDELMKLESVKRGGASMVAEREPEAEDAVVDPWKRILDHDELESVLSQLTAMQREVLVFHYYVGMEVRELSGFFGLPLKTVYTHLKRGREKALLLFSQAEERLSRVLRPVPSVKAGGENKDKGLRESRPPPGSPPPRPFNRSNLSL